MAGVVKGMDSTLKSMNLEKVRHELVGAKALSQDKMMSSSNWLESAMTSQQAFCVLIGHVTVTA